VAATSLFRLCVATHVGSSQLSRETFDRAQQRALAKYENYRDTVDRGTT